MYDWNDFQYVLALHEGGTMKRAAELLGTNPTTVSRRIKKVSENFGVMLFTVKKGETWTITPAGERLTRLASSFKTKLGEIDVEDPKEESAETITISSLEFLLANYLAPQLNEGINCFPDTRINLVGSDKRVSLAFGEADLALRFGRPKEGQLIASKIAEIQFDVWQKPNTRSRDWVGLQEHLDWTPEMQFAHSHFGRPPIVRTSSFSAARNVAESLSISAIGPNAVMGLSPLLRPLREVEGVRRGVWSVIHESRKLSQRLIAVRKWAKEAVARVQDTSQSPPRPNLRVHTTDNIEPKKQRS